jgi:hypothetical protein
MDRVQLGCLIVLGIVFVFTPSITEFLGHTIDTLPVRFAAVIIILAMVSYDRLIALAVFMVIMAIYIHHHQNDIMRVLRPGPSFSLSDTKNPSTISSLEHGGHADETQDTMDFVPKEEDQDNEFSSVGNSFNEKHALITEPLSTRSQSLFADDSRRALELERSNSNGDHE